MTIKLVTAPPPTDEGRAEIIEVSLPSELVAGSWITGTVRAQNVGTVEDDLRILITTEWNGKQYQGNGSVPIDYALRVTISEGVVTMPDIDAVITIEAQHLENGVWITDDTKSH